MSSVRCFILNSKNWGETTHSSQWHFSYFNQVVWLDRLTFWCCFWQSRSRLVGALDAFFCLLSSICLSSLSRKEIFVFGGWRIEWDFAIILKRLDIQTHPGFKSYQLKVHTAASHWQPSRFSLHLSVFLSPCFSSTFSFLSHTFLSSSWFLGKSCMGVIKLG